MLRYNYTTVDPGDWGLYFGFYNSGGTRAAADGLGFNNLVFNDERGYVGAAVFGTDTSGPGRYHVAERTSSASNLLASTRYTAMNTAVQVDERVIGTTYTDTLVISRTDASTMTITSVLAGLSHQSLTGLDTSSLVTSFDTLVIAYGQKPVAPVTIDSVQVALFQVPEPATAVMGLAGLVPFALRRPGRRRRP